MKKIFLFLLLTATAFSNIGTIMVTSGDAQVKRTHRTLKVTNGMDILKGDEIVTKKKTKVQVMLNDDTVITIGPDSSFSFLDYMFDGSKKSSIQMRANRGFFRSVTGKIGKIAPERFKVRTPLATIGIRGTDFSAQLIDDNAVYKCYRGEITLSFDQVQKNLPAGDQLLLQRDAHGIKASLPSKVKSKKIKALLKEHSEQVNIDASTLSNFTEIKVDTPKVKFNCETN